MPWRRAVSSSLNPSWGTAFPTSRTRRFRTSADSRDVRGNEIKEGVALQKDWPTPVGLIFIAFGVVDDMHKVGSNQLRSFFLQNCCNFGRILLLKFGQISEDASAYE
jgi:hypothetical protein